MPGLHTEVQQARTDKVQYKIRTRDRHKGDINITRHGSALTVMGLVLAKVTTSNGRRQE